MLCQLARVSLNADAKVGFPGLQETPTSSCARFQGKEEAQKITCKSAGSQIRACAPETQLSKCGSRQEREIEQGSQVIHRPPQVRYFLLNDDLGVPSPPVYRDHSLTFFPT
jgi:hypothetical protein